MVIVATGNYPAQQAAYKIVGSAAKVAIVVRDRDLVPEVMAMLLAPLLRFLQAQGAGIIST